MKNIFLLFALFLIYSGLNMVKLNSQSLIKECGINEMPKNQKLLNTLKVDEQEEVFASPVIMVGDRDFGKVNVNSSLISARISIQNLGDAELIITGYSEVISPSFTTDLFLNPKFTNISEANPLIILPGNSEFFEVYFKPFEPKLYNEKITFYANTDSPDPICELNGEGTKAFLSTNSYIWAIQNINTINSPVDPTPAIVGLDGNKVITLENSGNADITITNIDLIIRNGKSESFIFANRTPLTQTSLDSVFANKLIGGGEKFTAEVLFYPSEVGEHEVEITFNNSEGIQDITSKLFGTGSGIDNIEDTFTGIKLLDVSNTIITLKNEDLKGNTKVNLIDLFGNIIDSEIIFELETIRIMPKQLLSSGTYFINIDTATISNKNNIIKFQIN